MKQSKNVNKKTDKWENITVCPESWKTKWDSLSRVNIGDLSAMASQLSGVIAQQMQYFAGRLVFNFTYTDIPHASIFQKRKAVITLSDDSWNRTRK